MISAVVVFLLALSWQAEANLLRGNFFTPLHNDEHPCVAENLKVDKKSSSSVKLEFAFIDNFSKNHPLCYFAGITPLHM